MAELGVNIDHVATVREARKTYEPDPTWAAAAAQLGGADCITVHLREDRRHIQDRDLRLLREMVSVKLNLEISFAQAVVEIATQVRPEQVTLVPENRQEVTTEGGPDLLTSSQTAQQAIHTLRDAGIVVSLFLDPDPRQVEMARQLGAVAVELHTGQYALAADEQSRAREFERLRLAGRAVRDHGMLLHAGHGLNYRNVQPVAAMDHMGELNIGHAIVSRAIFVGMREAVREMKQLIA